MGSRFPRLTGQLASQFLIGPEEQEQRRAAMARICRSCHSTSWVRGHFAKLDSTLVETDRMTQAATKLIVEAWDRGIQDRTDPSDEPLEHLWISQWLFYSNSIRYGSAMGGQDYAAFKNGWWHLTHKPAEVEELMELQAASARK